MKRMISTPFVIAVGTLTLAIAAGQDVSAQAMGPQVTTLSKTDVAGAEGKEWNVITVELIPGAVDARRFHPGVKLFYVLEGSGVLEVDGKRPVALNLGTVAALGPKEAHVLKNTSRTQALKVLVIRLLEKGQPRSMLANGVAPKHQDGHEQMAIEDVKHPGANRKNSTTRPGLVF